MPTNFDPIRKWYSGKALTVIDTYVIPTLKQAEDQGFWPKGASRKVVGALSKQNVATKFASANERDRGERRREHAVLDAGGYSGLLCDVVENRRNPYCGLGGQFVRAMYFGLFSDAPKLLESGDKLRDLVLPGHSANAQNERRVVEEAISWAVDFYQTAMLVNLLDSRRPPRKVVLGTLSPTVAANLVDGIKLDVTTVRMPPTEEKWVKRFNPKTKREEEILVIRIVWPKNTVFGATRYHGTGYSFQCEACGHAIKDPFNWVPLLIDNDKGIPHAFWVGSDCARNLFGAEVEGEGLYEGRGA